MKEKQHEQHVGDILCCFRQTIRIMRLSLFFMVVGTAMAFSAATYSQSTKLSVNLKDATVREVFDAIERQSEYLFLYQEGQVDLNRHVSIEVKGRQLKEILDEMFRDTDNIYIISGRQVVIGKAPRKALEAQLAAIQKDLKTTIEQPQQREIKGMVTDNVGEPLPGATVMVKGTTIGTVTDAEGMFSLRIPMNAQTLQVSFVGMKTKEIPISGRTTFEIMLEEEAIGLEEVVAVGYGVQRKETLTGAISSIDSKEILKTKTTSLASSIQGKIPGVHIRQQTGEPGVFNSLVSIRGFGAPIIVIDGVVRDGISDFERLNPEDVESISILKDASAAIYGMNADNGVIIVTTKKGEKGKTKFSYSGYYGAKEPTGMEKTVDAYTYRLIKNEMERNIGNPIMFSQEELAKWEAGIDPGYQNHDWLAITLKDFTTQQQHTFSISGGTEKVSYYTSFAYTEDNGLLKSSIQKYKKYNFRNTLTAELSNNLSAKITISGRIDENKGPQGGYFWAFKPIMTADRGVGPFTIKNPNHLSACPPENQNPIALTTEKYSGYDKWSNRQFQGTVEFTYKFPFTEGLSLNVLGGYDANENNSSNLALGYYLYDYRTDQPISNGPNRISNYTNSNTVFAREVFQTQLNYKNTFNKVHNIGVMLAFEARSIENHYLTGKRQYDDVYTNDILDQASTTNQTTGGNRSYQRYLAYLGRFNYDYQGKYLAEATFRYDGSYRYAPGRRWAFFPGISVGWRISEEPFIKENFEAISNIKLRGSYGLMGADAGNPFEYVPGYKLSGIEGGYVFNDNTLTLGMVPVGITNNNLTWIETKTTNIGIDFDLWKGKLGFAFDLFQKERKGLLATRVQTVPNTFGASFPQENINSDKYPGVELMVSHKNTINDFSYGVSVNATYARKYLIHSERAPYSSTWEAWKDNWGNNRFVGREWIYKQVGRYTNMEQYETAPLMGGSVGNSRMLPGSYKIEDVNGDGVINGNDMLPIAWSGQYQGYAGNPPLQFGVNLNASWRSFDFNMLLQGAALFTIFTKQDDVWGYGRFPVLLEKYLDRWHTEDPLADPYNPSTKWMEGRFPALRSNTSGTTDGLVTDQWRHDAKYLRIKNMEIGYTLPASFVNKFNIESLRIYLNGFNLHTFTNKNLKNLDPEREEGAYQADLTYPLMKSFNFGMNINF